MANVDIDVAYESTSQEILEDTTSLESKVGSTGDTGGSSSAGTVFGKLNKIISDLATHIASWTSTRAGYIDTINTNASRLTSARATKIDNIGATSDTGGSATAGTVMGKLNALFTNISNIVTYTKANNTASKTGTLSQKDSYMISLLENSTYGLSALKTATGSPTPGFRSPIKVHSFAIYTPEAKTYLNATGKGTLVGNFPFGTDFFSLKVDDIEVLTTGYNGGGMIMMEFSKSVVFTSKTSSSGISTSLTVTLY